MKTHAFAGLLLLCHLSSLGQSSQHSGNNDSSAGYPFALVVDGKVITIEGDWKQSDRLRAYAASHPGSYIAFVADGHLLLQKGSAAMASALNLYDQVDKLRKQQEQLGAKQAPLGKQQALLSKRLKESASPEEMRRIGAEQGRVGGEQGALGREQGKLGQEQGNAGRMFYTSVEASLNRCIREHTCSQAQRNDL